MNPANIKRILPFILIICGLIGLGSAAILTQDTMHMLSNPAYRPSCDLNPIIACGDVMQSKQATVFGFPNPIIGLVAFPALITVGIAMLAGGTFKRWFWIGAELAAAFGIGFVHWLFFESVYRIHTLCPYCMGVWLITIISFVYVSVYNLAEGNLQIPGRYGQTISNWIQRHHIDIIIAWALIIFILIMHHFWYYYGKHL